MIKILVCGGRNFGHVVRTKAALMEEPPEVIQRLEEYKYIHYSLNELTTNLSENYDPFDNWLPTDITIIAGGATGVDRAAIDFAIINYCIWMEYPADWKKYGKAAGFIRNKQMLDEGKPDLVVAFPGGKGTAMMVTLANQAGVKVINMGTLGMATMSLGHGSFSLENMDTDVKDNAASFQTDKFSQVYLGRIAEFGDNANYLTFGQRKAIFMEVMKQERDWVDNMGCEYEEIMQSQKLME